MPPVVLVLLAGAAVLHVVWNVLLKTSGDPLATSARAVGWGLLFATPPVGAAWWVAGRPEFPAAALALAGASAVVELFYFVFLSAAYRRGDLSTVYPIARGSAPLLAVLIGLFILGERLTPLGYVGVVLLLGGLWLVRRPVGAGPAVGFALLTGVTIATYSAIDRLGVQAAPPWLYGWALWVLTYVALRVWLLVLRLARPAPLPARGPRSRAAVLGGAMIGAWMLVLGALSIAPLAAVAPLRESAIVLATGWGVLRLGEREGAPARLVGAAGIAAGVVLLALA